MADRFPAAGSRLRAFSSAGSGVSLSKNFDFSIAIKSPSVRLGAFFAAQRSFPWHLRGKGGLYFLRLLCGVAPTSSLTHSHSPEASPQRVAESFWRVWNHARLSAFSIGKPGQFPRSLCPHQDVLTAINRCRARRDPSGRSSATFPLSSVRPATTFS